MHTRTYTAPYHYSSETTHNTTELLTNHHDAKSCHAGPPPLITNERLPTCSQTPHRLPKADPVRGSFTLTGPPVLSHAIPRSPRSILKSLHAPRDRFNLPHLAQTPRSRVTSGPCSLARRSSAPCTTHRNVTVVAFTARQTRYNAIVSLNSTVTRNTTLMRERTQCKPSGYDHRSNTQGILPCAFNHHVVTTYIFLNAYNSTDNTTNNEIQNT